MASDVYTYKDFLRTHPQATVADVMAEFDLTELEVPMAVRREIAERSKTMEGLAVGRFVHYVLSNGEHRAAVIVRTWETGTDVRGLVNLQVFLDGSNDYATLPLSGGVAITQGTPPAIWWCTSVLNDDEGKAPGTWHWPERV